jgi:poly-beta-1,6-N-acetyl-D-glucosamine synthase
VSLTYGLVTAARNEARRLPQLGECIGGQTLAPAQWIVVDDGSTDDTASIAAAHGATVVRSHGDADARGGPVVRAFMLGLSVLDDVDVVVKLDADVTFGPEYFARLVAAFEADELLGMASGSCWELDGGVWRQRFGAGMGVWGATRAYRRECLRDVLPLEQRQGWDEIDAARANAAGWRTATLLDLPFLHHREEGERDGSRVAVWAAQGSVAHYMGYRVSYLFVRSVYHALREPSALAMLAGYASDAFHRRRRIADPAVIEHVRRHQRLRSLPQRGRQALGRAA